MRLSYKNPNDSYQNIIDSDLTNSYEGWFHAGTVTSELINGSLKVDVDAAWEGVQHQLNNMSVAPGDQLHVKLIFDKGSTQSNVRLYFQELDANGNHLSWNTLNGNLQTGTYSYPYTVNTASKLVLRIDKDNTNTGNLTSFYIDYVSVTTGELEIIEENNYYPFGLKHKGYNSNVSSNANSAASKFKYNGKELQEALGYNVYDYTARHYDPAIGRWLQLDPLAEKMTRHSPYNYAFDNPIYFVDPDGMEPMDWFKNKKGNIVWFDNKSESFTNDDGQWENIGSNEQEVKESLGIDGNTTYEFNSLEAVSFVGSDGSGNRMAVPGLMNFEGGVNITYDLEISNTGQNGELIDGKSEVTGIKVNARVGVTTSAPGVKLNESVGGSFSINKEWSPTGKNSTFTSDTFTSPDQSVLYGGTSGGATGDASISIPINAYKRITRNFSRNAGGVKDISIDLRVSAKLQQNGQTKSFSITNDKKL